MPTFKMPNSTGLNHAIRWIVTGQRFLSYADGHALKDYPEVESDEFYDAKRELLLAMRQGLIKATGNLQVFDERYSVYDSYLFGDELWDSFLEKYSDEVRASEDGHFFVGHGINIPCSLWEWDMVDWGSNCLHYRDGKLQARFLTCYVETEDLIREFSKDSADFPPLSLPNNVADQKKDIAHLPDLSDQERRSLLKLVAAMAVRGYKFNPNSARNRATSDIAEDLELVGVPLDQKTILKWLRESTALIAQTYHFDDEA